MFNAAAALGVEVRELAADADSVSFCLSKGLAAPVGSVVCGSAAFIQQARRNRKLLGGGMRQAGVIAAAGIVALEQMVERLGDDHANAQRLAAGLSQIPGLTADPARTQTNIVMFELTRPEMTPAHPQSALEAAGVRLFTVGGRRLRAVTHYEVSAEDINEALERVAAVMA
ncbi:beta-eliminating lyase-related protein [Candidatus Amarolinea dominans]|uniref:beta-eliminating lyase-related protein n=1 Tax=Candidatus Amarolinea dominans TaxID=3140696 RepID=UPI0031CC8972